MAIDYDLDCATSLGVRDVAARLAEVGRETGVLVPSVTGERLLAGAVTRLGSSVVVVAEGTPQPWHPLVAGLGLAPTVAVGFRMAKGVEVSDQQDDMVRLVMPLLERVDGDAVLHYQFERIWLLRRGGELSLDEGDELWPAGRLGLVGRPCRRETHWLDPV